MGPRHARSARINMQAKQAYTYSFLSCISVLFVSVVWYVYMSEGEGGGLGVVEARRGC